MTCSSYLSIALLLGVVMFCVVMAPATPRPAPRPAPAGGPGPGGPRLC